MYEYRVYYEDFFGKKIRKSFHGASDFECKEKAAQFFRNLEKQRHGVDITLTIPQIARMKCEKDYRANFTKEQGYTRNLETIKIIERSQIGSVPIALVTPEMLEIFLDSIRGYAAGTIQKIFQKVKGAFEWAKMNSLIDVDPFSAYNIRCPKSNKKNKRINALSLEEQRKLVDYLNSYEPYEFRNDYRIQLMIEMYAGLRMGEINALRIQDIDFKRNVICVRGTVSRDKNYSAFLEDETKTPAGIRDVPISEELLPYLRQAVDQYRENKYGLLFFDHVHNKLITTQQVNCFYGRVCEKLHIKNTGQHCLRHTFATRAIESGVDAVVLKQWMGHTKISITLDTYTDVFASLQNTAMTTMNDYIRNVF
jgi:integrase